MRDVCSTKANAARVAICLASSRVMHQRLSVFDKLRPLISRSHKNFSLSRSTVTTLYRYGERVVHTGVRVKVSEKWSESLPQLAEEGEEVVLHSGCSRNVTIG